MLFGNLRPRWLSVWRFGKPCMLFGEGQSCERLDGFGFSKDQFSYLRFAFMTGSIHFANLGKIALSYRGFFAD
jgi:hypothetical protein